MTCDLICVCWVGVCFVCVWWLLFGIALSRLIGGVLWVVFTLLHRVGRFLLLVGIRVCLRRFAVGL